MSRKSVPSELSVTVPVSPESSQLLAVFGKFGLAYHRWARSHLPVDAGLTVPRATMLLGLATKAERVSMGELAEFLEMSPRNVTVLVDGLEKENLVRRVPHERDRRATLIEITEEGKRVVEKTLLPSQLAIAELFEDLTPRDRKDLIRLMMKLLTSLQARGVEAPA